MRAFITNQPTSGIFQPIRALPARKPHLDAGLRFALAKVIREHGIGCLRIGDYLEDRSGSELLRQVLIQPIRHRQQIHRSDISQTGGGDAHRHHQRRSRKQKVLHGFIIRCCAGDDLRLVLACTSYSGEACRPPPRQEWPQ